MLSVSKAEQLEGIGLSKQTKTTEWMNKQKDVGFCMEPESFYFILIYGNGKD